MRGTESVHEAPAGGLRAGAQGLRGWRWTGRRELTSAPLRCKRDEWYIARARLRPGAELAATQLLVCFLADGEPLETRALLLERCPARDELLGWFKSPARASHVQVRMGVGAESGALAELLLHHVAERDPKCHPGANVPRWSTYRPPFTLQRYVLPERLAGLAGLADGQRVDVLGARDIRQLCAAARGAAVVLDPEWVRGLRLGLRQIEELAATSWLITDLEATAGVLAGAGHDVQLVAHAAEHEIMSARVEYSDVPTRGFALQDVLPYSILEANGGFRIRALKKGRGWKRYAGESGTAVLLSCETPWEDKHGDVLSAMRAVGGGEWLCTDLPWLVAGAHGPLLALRLAEHLLRTHLGLPVRDLTQYWNRWGDVAIIVRDIADLARRYAPLQAVRWAGSQPDVAHIGLLLPSLGGVDARRLIISTGRIDNRDVHDGVAPELMMILMRQLAREVRERTEWARRHLADQSLVWHFETADGLRYAANFHSAEPENGRVPDVLHVRSGGAGPLPGGPVLRLPADTGVHGDRSFDMVDRLMVQVRRALEAAPGRAEFA